MGITQGSFEDRSQPYFIRYAKSIKLKVQLINDKPEFIYPPYLDIDYETRLVDSVL